MTVGELIAMLRDFDYESIVLLEVGGDGAIHRDQPVRVYGQDINSISHPQAVVISGES